MARQEKKKDVVIVGLGWTGSIAGIELAQEGLDIVALERGHDQNTVPNFEYPQQIDELKDALEEGRHDAQDTLNALENLESTLNRRSVVDQIQEVIALIKSKPHSRRIIVSAWNPADLPDESISPQENVELGNMALAACHTLFQFYVRDGKLSCQLYQRSADTALGVPFNIASYALLTHMIAQVCDLDVGEFIWTGGDVHLYKNHIEGAKAMVEREPLPLPTLKLNPEVKRIDDFTLEDIELVGYQSHPTIKFDVAV